MSEQGCAPNPKHHMLPLPSLHFVTLTHNHTSTFAPLGLGVGMAVGKGQRKGEDG